MPPAFSAVIPTYRRPEALRRSIADLLAQTHALSEIIVVDNAPEGERLDRATVEIADTIRYVTAAPTRNANVARDVGWRATSSEYVLLLDDDLALPSDCVAQFAAVHAEGWDVVHGNLTERGASLALDPSARGNRPFWHVLRHHHGDERRHTIAVSSGFTSVRRTALAQIDGFDPAFAFHYDDYDLGYRLWRAGARSIHDPRPTADHLRVSEGREDRPVNPAVVTTAKYRFLRKHFSRRACRAELLTDVLLGSWDRLPNPFTMVREVVRHVRAYRRSRKPS